MLDRIKAIMALVFALADYWEPVVESFWGRLLRVDDHPTGSARHVVARQTQTVLTVVTLGLVIILGVLVYSEVQGGLPTPTNNDLSNASSNATVTFADSMELAPVIMIVLIAAVILGVVQRFR